MAIDVKITDNSGEFLKALPEQIEQALIAIGLTAETYAKEACPVDTGRLRNSITYQTPKHKHRAKAGGVYKEGDSVSRGTAEKNSVYIGTNVEYAAFVELGTSRKSPRPFLAPAATQHTEEYRQIVKDALKGG